MINLHATDELTLAERAETDASLGYAMDDAAMVEKIENIFRDALLMALSEARLVSVGMDTTLREKLMDGLSQNFNPDAAASDLFSDAFGDVKRMANDEVVMRAAE